ncbi:MAG: transporter permease, partial [Modestobacter sp.]|nr:transporter permease [Modestobacter sp.]
MSTASGTSVSGPSAPSTPAPGQPPAGGPLARLRRLDPSSYVVYVGFVAIFVVMSIALHDDGFLGRQNLINILLQTAPVTVMAVGSVFVLSTGEIDLSIGAVVALSALVSAVQLRDHGLVAGIVSGLLTGVVVGLVNGLLVTKLRLPSFLVTLGMMGLCAGLSQRLTQLQAVPSIDVAFNGLFGSGSVAGISTLILWSAAFVLV